MTKPKRDYPVENIRRLLEPGPIVLVSSAWKGETNIMTMGWHTVLEFTPSLVGCVIASSNHSFGMIRNSGECVINIPTADMVDTVVKIGNSDGDEIDKFGTFNLTPAKASKVKAPLVRECFANLECKIHDTRMVNKYNFFIFKVVKAHVTPHRPLPQTLHYHGQGIFTTDGRKMNKAAGFTKWRDTATF
ncbi:MAG: Flavoredoxin [Alphaproteobacteria bacterium]|jgi:flavin reductase (DIM6/NTAB) family NADH-FMN oxidoreductase RutF|nr:Flavoredoxin [Alphaproteobacteria bacterium]